VNKFALITVLALSAILVCAGCEEKPEPEPGFDSLDSLSPSLIIEGLTVDNYPKVDGSTSADPLNTIIACKLFGIRYRWVADSQRLRYIKPNLDKNETEAFQQLLKSSQTHESFINLINKEADLILVARKMSPDEKTYADAAGVSLIETPIALDALVFIVNPSNPIKSLTIKQIQDIYTGKITNWKEVGGKKEEIKPYVRNANSGSQELMETLVMKDLDMADLLENNYELVVVNTMTGAFDRVLHGTDALCYTVYYYKEYMITGAAVKSVAVNGIYPNKTTIGNKSYPYVAEVYAVIRSDLDTSSMAYKLYEWLQTDEGKQVISESGYVPN